MTIKLFLAFLFISGLPMTTFAFKANSYQLGLGYYSQNVLNKTGQNEKGETGLLGETSTPITFKYDFSIFQDWVLAPQLSHTLVPRQSAGKSTDITITHLSFLFGKNFEGHGSSWDWYFGPGILQQVIDGKGGTVQLLNGTTPTTFYKPSRTSTTRQISTSIGTAYNVWSSRFALDLIFENFFSSEKRSQSLMLSYGYSFGDGSSGGGGGRSSRPRGRITR